MSKALRTAMVIEARHAINAYSQESRRTEPDEDALERHAKRAAEAIEVLRGQRASAVVHRDRDRKAKVE